MVNIFVIVYLSALSLVSMKPTRLEFIIEVKAHTVGTLHTGIVTPLHIVFFRYQDSILNMALGKYIKDYWKYNRNVVTQVLYSICILQQNNIAILAVNPDERV